MKRNKSNKNNGKGNGKSSVKIQLFKEIYVRNGFNATKAAEGAGYSEKTAYSQGQRLLKNVEVSNFIEEYKQKYIEQLKITQDKLIKDLEIDKCMARALGQISASTGATKTQAQLLGMLVDKHEHKVAIINVHVHDAVIPVVSTPTNTNTDTDVDDANNT